MNVHEVSQNPVGAIPARGRLGQGLLLGQPVQIGRRRLVHEPKVLSYGLLRLHFASPRSLWFTCIHRSPVSRPSIERLSADILRAHRSW